MTQTHEFIVQAGGDRLDKMLMAELPSLSRAQLQAVIKEGGVTVNDKPVKAGEKLRYGDRVHIVLPEEVPVVLPQAEDIPLDMVYEDEVLAVINKPAGLVVHPGAGNPTGTLVNALLSRYPELVQLLHTEDDTDDEEEGDRVGIVHRLDKETSGLIVVARTLEAHRALSLQFQERTVEKEYIALLERVPKTLTGMVNAPIARDPRQRKRMSVQAKGRAAQTQFDVTDVDFKEGQCLVRLKILTGRTHQIRVHMAFIGCPVVGDSVYGFRKRRVAMNRQFLHATHLAFTHPVTGQRLTFDVPIPQELADVLARLR